MTEPQDTSGRIVRCARDLYLEGGLPGVSMRRVAACAGLSATAIYRHFRNKEELLIAVLEEGFRTFEQYMWNALAGEDPEERFRSTGRAYLDFAIEQPQFYKVIFMAPTDQLGFTLLPEAARQQFGGTFQLLVDRIRECIDAGIFRSADPHMLATTTWAHAHGLASLYVSGQLHFCADRAQFERLFWCSLEQILEGIRTQETKNS